MCSVCFADKNMKIGSKVKSSDVTSLDGLHNFTSLKYLDCSFNNIKYLDITNNKNTQKFGQLLTCL